MIDKTLARAVQALLISRGAPLHATGEGWEASVKMYESLCAKYPDYADSRSLVTDAFRDARTVLAAVQGWRDMSEAPKVGTFLVYLPQERRQFEVMYRSENTSIIGGAFGFDRTKPTHWQPLPRAPNEGE